MRVRRVFVVSKHPIFRQSVRLLLDHPDVEWVGASPDCTAARSEIIDLQPNTILVEETEGKIPTESAKPAKSTAAPTEGAKPTEGSKPAGKASPVPQKAAPQSVPDKPGSGGSGVEVVRDSKGIYTLKPTSSAPSEKPPGPPPERPKTAPTKSAEHN